MTDQRDSRRRGSDQAASQRARIETSAGGVIYRRVGGDTVFLLIRDPYENWGLPKGHVEEGETPEQAGIREAAEETGLVVSIHAELPTIDWYFRDHGQLVHKFCHFYLMESRDGDACPQVDEGISDCVWLPLEDALRTLTYSNAREVLRSAARWLAAPTDIITSAGG